MVSAVMTPYLNDGTVDVVSLKKHVRHIVNSGVKSIFVLGYAGECLSLSSVERRKVIEAAVDEVGDRAAIIAGVFGNSSALVLDAIKDAKACGADYGLCTPPNFLPLTQEETMSFFVKVAEEGGLPIVPYNCPECLNHLEPAYVCNLAKHPLIPALKETSNTEQLQRTMLALGNSNDDCQLLSGHEFVFLSALGLGIKGFIMGGPGNMFPGRCVSMVHDFQNGLQEKVRNQYLRMVDFLYKLYALGPLDIAACKAVLEIQGFGSRAAAHPLRCATDEEMERIRALMHEYADVFE